MTRSQEEVFEKNGTKKKRGGDKDGDRNQEGTDRQTDRQTDQQTGIESAGRMKTKVWTL